jgi:phosphatidylserine/phosphatidylglycerophosphate/cardiolipin synthase-like enzyme/regulation of enolase protein 1 (concanavalin A-like superfamily)
VHPQATFTTFRARALAWIFLAAAVAAAPATPAQALDRLCDTAHENCRTPLLELIRNETVGIDVGFWFMQDARYAHALLERWRAGVPIRVVFDSEAFSQFEYAGSDIPIAMMADAGIPLREKTQRGIFHFKMMLFAGQATVQFSAANYSSAAFVPIDPWVNYTDEVIYFTDDPAIVDSFKTRFDDVWTDTAEFSNWANVTSLSRHYPTSPVAGELNFVPWDSFRNRSVSAYRAETSGIDVIMYRITDRRHTDEMIAARARGVPVRLISEPLQYRSERYLWHAWNIDRMYAAGVAIRHRGHAGLTHEKLTILSGQGMGIFGSSNWTSASTSTQHEHNLFTTRPSLVAWLRDHFDRKWNNLGPAPETAPFVPEPPDRASVRAPADGADNQPGTLTLAWYAGPWAHRYDVYLGTSDASMTRILDDVELGPSVNSRDNVTWAISGLQPATTYYWQVVSRTMAGVSRTSPVWSFTTAADDGSGTTPSCGALPAGWTSGDVGAVAASGHACQDAGTATIAVTGSGADIWGTADEFRFVYRTLTGDGAILARVAELDPVDAWTKAGVMMRETLDPGSPHAMMIVSAGKGLAFQRREAAGGPSLHAGGGSGVAPQWVRLERSGNTFTAARSADGDSWTIVGTATIVMAPTIHVGLPVTSHRDGSLARGTFMAVAVSGSTPGTGTTLPDGWTNADVGSVGAAGSAGHAGDTFTIEGSGRDIWYSADEFHFVSRTMTGDGSITARVRTIEAVHAWTKAGVMMRETLDPGARHAMVIVSSGKALAFQRRVATGGATVHTTAAAGTAPYWVRLVRTGDVFTAAVSADGSAWTTVGDASIPMAAMIHVGLPVTSHDDGILATATIDEVHVLD